jgi:hypothetical protein
MMDVSCAASGKTMLGFLQLPQLAAGWNRLRLF